MLWHVFAQAGGALSPAQVVLHRAASRRMHLKASFNGFATLGHASRMHW